MEQISLTPFGRRPVSAAQLAACRTAVAETPAPSFDKWQLFDALRTAREAFGLGDRTLGVLYALLSFHPARALEDGPALIVFPSNRSLSERANGMAESTLRRHLAALVEAGLIVRHDSPNGKRYARRGQGGRIADAYGFNLRPLLVRSAEIVAAADATREAEAACAVLRERISLMVRDGAKLTAHLRATVPGDWDALEEAGRALARTLRRKLPRAALESLLDAARTHVENVKTALGAPSETPVPRATDSHSGRHSQRSKTDVIELEPAEKPRETPPSRSLPLPLVLDACPAIADYGAITSWHDLITRAAFVRTMMGITDSAWDDACARMGPVNAAITVAAILERVDRIARPGGYLRALTARALAGTFSPAPMVMALLNRRAEAA